MCCPSLFKMVDTSVLFLYFIQDTGISVRKRVIKILRDICLTLPDFPKVTEICVKIIRRISDEEGIKASISYLLASRFICPMNSYSEKKI